MKKLINISLVPTLYEKYKNQFEFSIDVKWLNFIKNSFDRFNLELFDKSKKTDLIILGGGNDLKSFSKKKEDLIRHNYNLSALKYAIKNKTPIIGICLGAMFISAYFGSRIIKSTNHRKKHKVYFFKKKKVMTVNSYHNYIIKDLSIYLKSICYAKDNSIELYKHKNLKVYGMMWHPERNSKINRFDKKFFKDICN